MILRKATEDDKEYFYALRSDPLASRMSRRAPLTKEEHDKWWHYTPDYRFVADADGSPVGTIRLGVDGTISIIVAPGLRGQGVGTAMLKAFTPIAKELGFRRMWAEVAEENAASQRAFIKAGWSPILFEIVT